MYQYLKAKKPSMEKFGSVLKVASFPSFEKIASSFGFKYEACKDISKLERKSKTSEKIVWHTRGLCRSKSTSNLGGNQTASRWHNNHPLGFITKF